MRTDELIEWLKAKIEIARQKGETYRKDEYSRLEALEFGAELAFNEVLEYVKEK